MTFGTRYAFMPLFPPMPSLFSFARTFVGGVTVAWLLGACAPLAPHHPQSAQSAQYSVGRTRLSLPVAAGQHWQDLGHSEQVAAVVSDKLGEHLPLHTRTLALRGPRDELLALLRVQVNASNYQREHLQWTGRCPAQEGIEVQDGTQGGTVRIDCLRHKRYARPDWLAQHEPSFTPLPLPWPSEVLASFVSYRYASERGAFVQVDVWADQRLLRPATKNSFDFMQAGQPAQAWGRAVAQAARQSTAMVDGFLALPPFPFPRMSHPSL